MLEMMICDRSGRAHVPYHGMDCPKVLLDSFRGIFNRNNQKVDILKDIELPMWVFLVGIPLVGVPVVILGHVYFGIHYALGLFAIPLVFVFTLIAVDSTGLTSITPGGALAKLTQLTFAIAAPGNITTNILAEMSPCWYRKSFRCRPPISG